MSLKAFHIIFILASMALSVIVGIWGIHHAMTMGGGRWPLVLGLFFFAVAAGLAVYLFKVVRKLRGLKEAD